MTHPGHLDKRDATKLRGIRDRDSDLEKLTAHVRAFAAMMTGRASLDLLRKRVLLAR